MILLEELQELLLSIDEISSVALWIIMSTFFNCDKIGRSNVRGKNIKPFWVGFSGNAPL